MITWVKVVRETCGQGRGIGGEGGSVTLTPSTCLALPGDPLPAALHPQHASLPPTPFVTPSQHPPSLPRTRQDESEGREEVEETQVSHGESPAYLLEECIAR